MTIVVAVDRSSHRNNLVEEGAKLADALGQELHIVHVLSQQKFIELERTSVEQTRQTIDKSEIERIAAEIAREAIDDELNVTYETIGCVGVPSDEIISYTEEVDAEYLVIGGRRRSPVGKAIMGSVTQSVLLGAACPVVGVLQSEHDR